MAKLLGSLGTVGLAGQLQDDGAIDDAVQDSHGQGWIGEVFGPAFKVDVGDHGCRATRAAGVDHLVEEAGGMPRLLALRPVKAELVDDKPVLCHLALGLQQFSSARLRCQKMIRSTVFQELRRAGRMDAKSLDNLFRRRIEEGGANCPPFVSQAILQIVKEVFVLDADATSSADLGKVRLLVVAAGEPAGKSIDACQKVTVCLTLDAGKDDQEIRCRQGVTGLRRARILRLAVEAREQDGLLSYEDLAYRLLNCGVRTVVRDVEAMRRASLQVPTRGQQQDIGPGQTHRVLAVDLFLRGHEPKEIARHIYHSLSSVENYLTTFARVAFLANQGYGDDEVAFLLNRSTPLVAAYRRLYDQAKARKPGQRRLDEILARVERPRNSSQKGGVRQ